jgi:inner membrane protein
MNTINDWVRYSVTSRIIIIGVLSLILLIPVQIIKELVRDRASLKDVAIAEISQKWGGQQIVAGPILSVPYKTYIITEKGERVSTTAYAHFLPETLNIDGTLRPEKRSRGIFDAVVYSSDIKFSGKFLTSDILNFDTKDKEMDWNKAFVSVGISDVRGVENTIDLNWNDEKFAFKPGVLTNGVIRTNPQPTDFAQKEYYGEKIPSSTYRPQTTEIGQNSGVSVVVPIRLADSRKQNRDFSFTLKLKGSQNIQFIPVGKTTEIALSSDWNNPSFSGAFLPDTREVTDKGFTAVWKIIDINRGYPQSWTENAYDIYASASGVELLAGIDGYGKTTRSAKYALLIIALTFLIFFFAEIFNKKKIHPIQYILVGLSLVLFYSLLVSTSEIIGFASAYAVSSIAIIGLITLYSTSVLANKKMATIQGLILSFLYVFIFILLQLEDYALLIGSILLFIILAVIMFISRKVDWYAIK